MNSADTGSQRFEVRLTADTHFGWLRTRLSVERTMMSWIRTAVSLIGFGFSIVQFFERMDQMPGVQRSLFPNAPMYLGLALIACGILPLIISIWQYQCTARYLRSGSFGRCRTEAGNAIASPGGRRPSHPDRPVCFRCRAAAPGVTTLG